MKKLLLAIAAIAMLLSPAVATAQQSTGTIAGLVTDATGGALPGVTVDARQIESGFTRSDVTNERGAYRLTALPVGNYVLTVDLAGFKRVERPGIIVNVAQQVDLNFTLEVGSIEETIQVTGETPAGPDHQLLGRRRRGREPHREPAAQRAPVRQPGDDDSGCRPRVPLRPDQEHAVLAADRRRQWP